jgi:hypothetical protein
MMNINDLTSFGQWVLDNQPTPFDAYLKQKPKAPAPPVTPEPDEPMPQYHRPRMHGPGVDYHAKRELERQDIEHARKNGVGSLVHHPMAGPVLHIKSESLLIAF